MQINEADADTILGLISFADAESCASKKDFALALRLMDAFPALNDCLRREECEKWLAYEPPPLLPPKMLNLSLAAVVPGLWPPATGLKHRGS